MKKIVSLALLTSLSLYAEVSPNSGYKYGNLEVTKQYGKKDSNGNITNLRGSEVGEFRTPESMVVLSDGSYWVVDRDNHRIQHFTKSGEFLGKVGAVNSSDNPVTGTDNSSFNTPKFIAKDSNDNLYVTDSSNKRVQKFSSDGEYMDTITNAKVGEYLGIAVDSASNIWISDTVNDHLWKLDQYGALKAEAGFVSGTTYDAGDADGQFNNPYDIEVAADNSIWVADQYNNRVQHISSSGEYLGQVYATSPVGVALSSSNVYAVGSSRVFKYSLSSGNKFISEYYFESSTSEKFGLSTSAWDIEINAKDIWIVDSGNNRIKKTFESEFKTITLEQRVAKLSESDASLYTSQADIAGFYNPKRAVGDADGNSFVLDSRSLRKFNAAGEDVSRYGKVDANGNFTSGVRNNGVTEYSKYYYGDPKMAIKGSKLYLFTANVDENGGNDSSKTYVHTYATSDMSHIKSFEVEDDTNMGIAPLADGSVWLAYPYHIVHYSADGAVLKTIGITNSDGRYISGSDKEQFYNIGGVAADASENIYVTDSSNKRIQVFSKTGAFIKLISLGFTPSYIAVSPTTDALWVSDNYGSSKIYRMDSNGKISYVYNSLVTNSEFNNIYGIGFNNQGDLLLTDYSNHDFLKYSIGTFASPTQIAPEVSMDVSVESGNTVSVNAEAYDEDGYISSYLWNFGDKSTGTTAASTHTYSATGTYTISCKVTDNEGVSTELKQAVLISSLSVGTSTNTTGQATAEPIFSYTQDDVNSAKADQIASCQDNPSGCGITVSHDSALDISASTIENLSSGWSLLGTTIEITDMTMFNDAQAVWIRVANEWKAYSANSAIAAELTTNGVATFSTIPASSGFWVQK